MKEEELIWEQYEKHQISDNRERDLAIWLRNRLNRALQTDEWQRFSLEKLLKELELVKGMKSVDKELYDSDADDRDSREE